MKNISVSASAAVVCLLTAIGSVGADYQGIPSNTLDTGVDIETRYRVYININSGDKVSGIFGGTVEPLMISSIGGVVIFQDRKSTRLNSSHVVISYAVFCLKKKKLPSRSEEHV